MRESAVAASSGPHRWPEEGLESPGGCPVCGDQERELLYEGLWDRVFYCAPGSWHLHRCGGCGAGYLDPRPTPDTVALAYRSYYTHEPAGDRPGYESLSWWRRGVRRAVNGYTNARYGTRFSPASAAGGFVLRLSPCGRRQIDRAYRHLPPLPPGGEVLDVGCGNGFFLKLAGRAGWSTVGVDPDPQVVAQARKQGLVALEGGIERLCGEKERFDAITGSHVLEHLHDPMAALRDCYRLLKPGGTLWLETPNLESLGHRKFGRHWRGLEPPRYLALFTPSSLRLALESCGFVEIGNHSRHGSCSGMFAMSRRIREGRDPNLDDTPPLAFRVQVLWAMLAEQFSPRRREFLTVSCRKPRQGRVPQP